MATVENFLPARCPECAAVEGMPFRAANVNAGVGLRCRLCRYEWELEMAVDTVVLAPKPDRRKLPNQAGFAADPQDA